MASKGNGTPVKKDGIYINALAIAYNVQWVRDGVTYGYFMAGPRFVQVKDLSPEVQATVLAEARRAAGALPPPWEKPDQATKEVQ